MTWLGFGVPIWLAGLAALAVPVAIHWLSRGRQRRMKIGSIRWLVEAETKRARRLSPSRWWLLMLRCLLLAQVVAALALPRLAIEGEAREREWVLVAPEAARDRDRLEPDNVEVYRWLDKKLSEGGELHWLSARAPRGEMQSPPEPVSGDVWSWIQEAHLVAPPGAALSVVATDRAVGLSGARPTLGRTIDWHEVTDPRPNRWIERATAVDEETVTVFVAESDRASTRYERVDVQTSAPPGWPLEVERRSGRWRVALAEGGGLDDDDVVEISLSVTDTEVAILSAAERAEDARYIRTALEAVREVTASAMTIREQVADSAAEVEANDSFTDVFFWLSPEPVPPAIRRAIRQGGVLVSDALDRFETCDCEVLVPEGLPARFDRLGPVEQSAGATVPLWTTAAGVVVLEAERLDEGIWLRYHSRFHPAWTDLVLGAALPQWLLDLVQPVATPASSSRAASSDRRAAPGQSAPRLSLAEEERRPERELPLEPWLWLAAFILACGERLVAARSVA